MKNKLFKQMLHNLSNWKSLFLKWVYTRSSSRIPLDERAVRPKERIVIRDEAESRSSTTRKLEMQSVYIGGKWLKGKGAPIHSINPATGEEIGTFYTADEAQVAMACEAAASAKKSWADLSFDQRQMYLSRFTELVESEKENLAKIISLEVGKPLWDSAMEVEGIMGKLALSIDAYTKRCHEFFGGPAITRFKPHGVMGVIGPFNFPAHVPNGHITPALLAGNVVILKPSELTPLTAHKVIELWDRAKLPPGVINLLQGGPEVGKALIANHETNGVLFTGSAKAGIDIRKTLASRPEVILALEMGGNNPMIVDKTKDLHAAVMTIIQSAYLTSGQRCTCTRRLILTESRENEALLEKLAQTVKKILVGPYDQKPEPFMGPVIQAKAAERVIEFQLELIKKGAKALVESKLLKTNTGLITPGIIDVTPLKKREDVEIFGPLLQIIRVPTLEDAVEEANNTVYGLCAGLISDDAQAYKYFYNTIKAGILNWNQQLTGSSSAVPFGGVKLSGNYRPSGYFACDYCAYPVSSIEKNFLSLQTELPPGLPYE